MSLAIQHRGPDDDGIFIQNSREPAVGLASRRLSIIDLSSAGHMPMCNQDETIWIVYNGEIYNHEQIRQGLAQKYACNFKSRTDTETVLYAYQAYGLAALDGLNGIFAFALYDRRENHILIARDRMGVKPLYYSWDGNELVFASELKAMIASSAISLRLDHHALELYLGLGYVPSPYSLVAGVKKLSPGKALLLHDRELSTHSFWEPALRIPEEDVRTQGELVEQVRSTLDSAVKDQLMSDVPLGVLLSGGLDSSIVTAISKKYQREPLHTFSVGFETRRAEAEPMYNWDRESAKDVAVALGTQHHEILIRDDDRLIPKIERLVSALDEPVWETSFLSIYEMAQTARSVGIKVLLSGDGSDEIFGGYPWYLPANQFHRYERIPGLKPVLGGLDHFLKPGPFRSIARDIINKYKQATNVKYLYNYQHFSADYRRSLLSETGKVNGQVVPDFIAEILRPVAGAALGDQFAFADQMLWVRDHFNQRLDRMMMLASVEGRVPFQDNRVIALAMSVGIDRKIIGKRRKALLYGAYENILPALVLNRPKRPFATPAKAWLQGTLKEYALDILNQRSVNAIGCLNGVAVENYVHAYLNAGNFADPRDTRFIQVMNLLILSIWLRKMEIST